eukprot:SAG31_NODE_2547_length_5528_cov_4.438202_5_plen_349_part_00
MDRVLFVVAPHRPMRAAPGAGQARRRSRPNAEDSAEEANSVSATNTNSPSASSGEQTSSGKLRMSRSADDGIPGRAGDLKEVQTASLNHPLPRAARTDREHISASVKRQKLSDRTSALLISSLTVAIGLVCVLLRLHHGVRSRSGDAVAPFSCNQQEFMSSAGLCQGCTLCGDQESDAADGSVLVRLCSANRNSVCAPPGWSALKTAPPESGDFVNSSFHLPRFAASWWTHDALYYFGGSDSPSSTQSDPMPAQCFATARLTDELWKLPLATSITGQEGPWEMQWEHVGGGTDRFRSANWPRPRRGAASWTSDGAYGVMFSGTRATVSISCHEVLRLCLNLPCVLLAR